MDLIAKRDHSEKELKQKLSRVKKWDNEKARFSKERLYTDEEIKTVIEWARDNRWIQEGTYLSERWAESLNRKKKGIKYINAYLSQKGLPAIKKDEEIEVDKAVYLLKRKIGSKELDPAMKAKLTRFLMSRGFDSETIRKAFKQV
jgi:regulatory protein